VLQVPVTLRRAAAEARAFEAEGNSLAGENPAKSLLLFQRALKLAGEAEQEKSLTSKIAALAGTTAPREPLEAPLFNGENPASSAAATVIGHAPEHLRVGPEKRYCLEGELGRGAMGIVYRARDEVLERMVALKELPVYLACDEDLVLRFRREARILAQLQHPNIVQIYDLIEHDGHLWLAMEMVEGGDLDSLLRARGNLPATEAARLGVQMADALAHAHARGIIHRDLKTANVLLGTGGCPKVTDFGLAKLSRSSQFTQEGAILGSPIYMSPEQAAGKGADERSDIYALGIVLYTLLTGRPPFEGDTASVLAQQITQAPPSPCQFVGELPEGLEALLLALLAKDPVRRPQEMAEVAAALRPFAAG
jgi:serine/threonine-protein kinase